MDKKELFDRFGTDAVVLIDTKLKNHNDGDEISMLNAVSDLVDITRFILNKSEDYIKYLNDYDLNLELDHNPTLTRQELASLIISTVMDTTITKYNYNTDFNKYKLRFIELKLTLINAIYTYINLLTENELKFEVALKSETKWY